MLNKPKNSVGRDDDGWGWLIYIVIVIMVVMSIVMLVVFVGGLIGMFYSLKNYITSFKRNVIDDNRGLQTA